MTLAPCREQEKKATGRNSFSCMVTDSIPAAIIWSNVSVLMVIRRSGTQWQSTGAEEKLSFSVWKAVVSALLKVQGVAFLHKLVSGRVSCE